MAKQRIIIVGGGPAGLATAFELSATAALRARYDVRVLTLGWRLGGKCASSRNSKMRWRNEEHGLHILGGFYHNTFAILNALYRAWPGASSHAIAFADAFAPHHAFTVMESRPRGWRPVTVDFPSTRGRAGVNPKSLSLTEALRRLWLWTADLVDEGAIVGRAGATWNNAVAQDVRDLTAALAGLSTTAEALADPALNATVRGQTVATISDMQARVDAALALATADDPRNSATPTPSASVLSRFSWPSSPSSTQPGTARAPSADIGGADWIALAGLALTVTRGLIADNVAANGFDSLNHLDAMAWLASHGASERVQKSGFVQSGYHYAFAFRDGDPARPDFAAGVALRGLLRMFFTYEGSVFIHMKGGMGEIFATPFYEVLKARGVRFAFFHKLTSVEPAAGGAAIARIVGRKQAHVSSGDDAYAPLVEHLGRRCWPGAPLDAQLAAPHAPATEAEWDYGGPGVADFSLEAGRDFDIAVLAVPPPVLTVAAAPLAAQKPRWARMLSSAATTPTIGAQIWYDCPPARMEPPYGGIATAYATPLSTWSDMSFLTKLEDALPGHQAPAALTYLCGPAPLAAGDAATQTRDWLKKHGGALLPGLGAPDATPHELERMTRFNTSPTDLYVLSPAGAVADRMATHETGYVNLRIAGDWIKSGADVGAVEAAVMAGRQAARSISGSPTRIYGERDFE